jgi:O-antigen/teichoic acid export membrane protein
MTQSISRKLFAHGSIYTFSRLFNQASRFILLPIYAAYLGKDGYGVISLMWTVGTFLGFVFAQGLVSAWFRFRYDCHSEFALKQLETTILLYLFLSNALVVLVLTLCGELVSTYLTPGVAYYPLGYWTILTFALLLVPNLYERKLQAEQRPLAFAIFTAARTALGLAAIILFLVPLRWGAYGKIVADLVAACLVSLYCVYTIRPGDFSHFSMSLLKKCLRYGWPLIPHSLAGLTNEMIDRILISQILGHAANGVYSMGYSVASVAVWIAIGLNQSFSPLFIQQIKDFEKVAIDPSAGSESHLQTITRAGLQMVAFVGCIALLLTAFSRELLFLLPGNDFDESWQIVAPVTCGSLSLMAYYVFAQPILYDRKRAGLLALASIPAALLNLFANLYLLPRIGIIGAAFTTWLSNSVMMIVTLMISRRMRHLPYQWSRWGFLFVTTTVGLALVYCLDFSLTEWSLRLLLKGVFAIGFGLALLKSVGASVKTITSVWKG